MISDAKNLDSISRMGVIRVWLNNDDLKKIKDKVLTDGDINDIIQCSLSNTGWNNDYDLYPDIVKTLKEALEFIQKRNYKLPHVEDYKRGGRTIRLSFYPKDSLDWISENT